MGGAETDPKDIRLAQAAWANAREAILSPELDLVVLDETNCPVSYGMLDASQVAQSLLTRPRMLHVILTGRKAHPVLVELADNGH